MSSIQITVRHHLLRTLVLVLLAQPLLPLLPTPAARAQSTPTPTLLVDPVGRNGTIALRGYDFAAGSSFQVRLVFAGVAVDLGSVTSDRSGNLLSQHVPLPNTVEPGEQTIIARDAFGADIATTTLKVHSAPRIALSTATSYPGGFIEVTVTGLQVGSIRIDFGGETVIGPLSIRQHEYSGIFLIPAAREATRNEAVAISAYNFVGDRLYSAATTTVTINPREAESAYSVEGLRILETNAQPGQLVTLVGKVVPQPLAGPGQITIDPFWHREPSANQQALAAAGNTKAALSQRFPIGVGLATIQQNGDFQIMARLPNVLHGDPIMAAPEDRLGVVLNVGEKSPVVVENAASG